MKEDLNIARKGKIIVKHLAGTHHNEESAPFFSLVEFNICGLCNRTCPFCPRANPDYPNKAEYIPLDLYEKVMSDLSDISYTGIILYSAFSEPLLHKQVDQLIFLSKRYCPQARVEIVTNGDFLTSNKLISLFEAGLNTILISLYDGPHQHERFLAMKHEAALNDNQFILRVRYLPKEEHYGITMSNRAGLLNLEDIGIVPLDRPLKQYCCYPFYQCVVDYDGSVLLCPHDWKRALIAGNLNNESLLDIWNGKVMSQARKRLLNRNRNFSPCKVCDVDGTKMGRKHFKLWQRFYEKQSN